MAFPRMTTLIDVARGVFRTDAAPMHALPDDNPVQTKALENAVVASEFPAPNFLTPVDRLSDSVPADVLGAPADNLAGTLPEIFSEESVGTQNRFGAGDTFSFGGAFPPAMADRATGTVAPADSPSGPAASTQNGSAFEFLSLAQDDAFDFASAEADAALLAEADTGLTIEAPGVPLSDNGQTVSSQGGTDDHDDHDHHGHNHPDQPEALASDGGSERSRRKPARHPASRRQLCRQRAIMRSTACYTAPGGDRAAAQQR